MSSTRVVPREQIKRRKKWPNILACKWMPLYPPNHPRAGYISPVTVEVLLLANPHLYQAANKLNKNLPTHFYTLQLLQRNYQIVEKAHTIYAFGILEHKTKRWNFPLDMIMSSTRVVPREQIKRRRKWPNILACTWMSLYPPNHPRVEVLSLANPHRCQAANKLNKNLPTHFYTL